MSRQQDRKEKRKVSAFMKERERWKRYENCMIALMTMLVNAVFLSVRYDFYYDLNDDVFMRDIMAGAYTGTPDGHNVQTLYILGAFISLFYKIYRAFPWYGVFLFLCQMGSLYLIGVRLLGFCGKVSAKAGCMAVFTLFLWGMVLPHMVILHYTFISAVLAASAIFLFITTPKGLTSGQFIVRNIPSVLLAVLAYQLRTEMLLLLFPLIGLAGLFRWSDEDKFFQKENYMKYGIVLFCVVFGMLGSRAIDFAAYGSEDWKEYLVFFDKRTEVYDYHLDVVTSGEHEEFLSSVGLNAAQQELLSNYNFGLDESIDARLMSRIADYAGEDTDYAGVVFKQARYYLYRTLHAEDAPYNVLVLFLYGCIVFTGGCIALTEKERRGKWSFLWKILLLGACRTALWMFILIKGRYPERITHSLYFAEAVLLFGMLCMQLAGWRQTEKSVHEKKRDSSADGIGGKGRKLPDAGKRAAGVIGVLLGLLCVYHLPQNIGRTAAEAEKREDSYVNCQEIARYCKAHPDNFYFKDVYSTVGLTRKVFVDEDNSLANHDIMGGWLCKSPLYDEKLGKFGIGTMEEGLSDMDNVYFMTLKEDSTDWLAAYYAGKEIAVSIEQVDLIADTYAVYRLIR